jgi:hypothetical protein
MARGAGRPHGDRARADRRRGPQLRPGAGRSALHAAAGDHRLGTLEGGPGADRLIAGGAAALAGGPGADRLDGSPRSDVLVDAGDRGSRDVIACRGGAEITQGDRGDRLEGCNDRALDALSKVRHRWRVFPGIGLTEPMQLRVRDTDYVGLQAPFAECLGRRCAGARLDSPPRAFRSFRIVRGGVRHRWNGRVRRTVRAGATIRVGSHSSSAASSSPRASSSAPGGTPSRASASAARSRSAAAPAPCAAPDSAVARRTFSD